MGRSVHVDANRVAEPDALWGTVVIKAKAMSALRSEQAFTEALDVRRVFCNTASACRGAHFATMAVLTACWRVHRPCWRCCRG